jgi:hypothetical protein
MYTSPSSFFFNASGCLGPDLQQVIHKKNAAGNNLYKILVIVIGGTCQLKVWENPVLRKDHKHCDHYC